MAEEITDPELYAQAEALLEPGDIELNGLIVHTGLDTDAEATLHELTIEIGDIIAEHVVPDEDIYVYSGNDDPEFGLNQHQGLTLDGDEFVWECQQLRREGEFKVVFYYEKGPAQDALVADVRDAEYTVESVEG